MLDRRRAVTVLLGVVLLCGCRGGRPGASGPGRGDDVVAEGSGARVTRDELDQRAADRLRRIRQEEYDLRRQVLEEIVAERLLEKEAAARGMTREALVQSEVDAKVPEPSSAEVDAVYEGNRGRLGGRSRAEVGPEISRMLRQQVVAARNEAFRQELQKKAGVRILLEAPRIEVAVPTDAPSLGPGNARVTIVEFSDYQCPYCRRAQPTIEKVLAQYSGKVRFVHRDFPLEGHPRAVPAAQAARCAGEQGRFWEYHRALLGGPGDLSDEDLRGRAKGVGVDAARFTTCLASSRHEPAVRKGFEDGGRVSVTGTPTFFINGRMLTGAQPFERFEEVIDSELAGAR